jgi:hypothetical protein
LFVSPGIGGRSLNDRVHLFTDPTPDIVPAAVPGQIQQGLYPGDGIPFTYLSRKMVGLGSRTGGIGKGMDPGKIHTPAKIIGFFKFLGGLAGKPGYYITGKKGIPLNGAQQAYPLRY